MIRIVFKTGRFPEISETFILNQVISAIRLGYNVRIIVDEKCIIDNSSQKALIKQYNLLEITTEIKVKRPKNKIARVLKALYLVITGIPFKYLTTFNYFKYNKEGLSGKLFYQLVALNPFLNADIFHIQFGVNAPPLERLKKYGLIKGKLITTFHGFDSYYNIDTLSEKRRFYEDLFLVGSLFTCNSTYLKRKIIQLGCPESKLKLIPMGIDTELFEPAPSFPYKDKIYLLSVGRLVKLKGYEFGIRAVKVLKDRGINVRYTIIGQGIELENLQMITRKLGLTDSIIFTGAKKQDLIIEEMQKSDVFLMTSTYDETGRREAQGVVTAEAQACGLPICAFRSGGVPDTIKEGETGFLSEENDYVNMANNIEKLISNPELRHKMSKNAKLFIENFYSLKITTQKMHNAYQSLLSNL